MSKRALNNNKKKYPERRQEGGFLFGAMGCFVGYIKNGRTNTGKKQQELEIGLTTGIIWSIMIMKSYLGWDRYIFLLE